ncbi:MULTISPECIES: PfkB family carbohydrate kinase [Salipiger]|uniref:PfkB family carbohydrate kinase n=1 Tax=Salipiger TaxID=263377 RepID=UPI0013DAD45B|nr:PfkB family carbohydrate kinase [Salipiger sp. PrR003]NDV49350.1 fructoselysine 6-kinase [Salipiger sp. PrR003]
MRPSVSNSLSAPLITVGDNCLDVYVDKNLMAVGGNALNVAVQWARAGHPALYLGAIGNDPEGDIMFEQISRTGLSTDGIERRTGGTAVTLIRERDGDRRFLLEDLGVGECYEPIPESYAALQQAGWVHLGTHSSPRLVNRLVADAIPFSIDISTERTGFSLAGVSIVFASGPEDKAQPVSPILDRLHADGAETVVLTCGPRGAFFSKGGLRRSAPAHPVQVVDTCGAGDSFIARFLADFAVAGLDPEIAMAAATEAAALTCQHAGGFPQPLRKVPGWLPSKYKDLIAGTKETSR